ncbi:MAG: DUF1566 domain-containing protein [Polyangiaceae bacterium]
MSSIRLRTAFASATALWALCTVSACSGSCGGGNGEWGEDSGTPGAVVSPGPDGAPDSGSATDDDGGGANAASPDASDGGSNGSSDGSEAGALDSGADSAAACTAAACSLVCGTGLVCERYSTLSCGDPAWADWPMPNDPSADPGAPNPESYTDNGDGTVTDNVTGLMWQQAVPTSTYPEDQAETFCASLALAGHCDWRLPSVIELVSIEDDGEASPSIDPTYFPSTPADYFWTSTANARVPGAWWDISFAGYQLWYTAPTDPHYVRCVR